MNSPTQVYIRQHINEDVRQLALRPVPTGVNLRQALQQIEGRQLATRKLPSWAATDGLLFPPHLALEQCSSEGTAGYKRLVVSRLVSSLNHSALGGSTAAPVDGGAVEAASTTAHSHSSLTSTTPFPATSRFADLTGGFGVDFAALAPLFEQAIYVERQSDLCDLVRHNLPLLGLPHAEVLCAESEEALPAIGAATLLFIDPARRDGAGRKVTLISDCSPDLIALQPHLLEQSRFVMAKLSPMLDITAALRSLHSVAEVHVVSVGGECKELLFILAAAVADATPTAVPITCVDIPSGVSQPAVAALPTFVFTQAEEATAPLLLADNVEQYLYEPHASILKAGAFKTVCHRYPVRKLSRDAHLYTSASLVADFPGRIWRVIAHSSFAKHALKAVLGGATAADITVRGFPLTVGALRQQLHLREGGQLQLIATTLADGQRRLISVERLGVGKAQQTT